MIKKESQQMYLQNKYTSCYYRIVNRAKDRTLTGYTEKHHIIPKSLGGDNSSENIAILTAREHFICHLLLTRMVIGKAKQKMFYALHAMSHLLNENRYISSRVAEMTKIECARLRSIARKGIMVGDKNYNYGNRWTEEQRDKMRGHTRNLGKKKSPFTQKTKDRQRNAALLRWTDEERAKFSAYKLEHKIIKTCPHCGKHVDVANYSRWHGDNCKSVKSINT